MNPLRAALSAAALCVLTGCHSHTNTNGLTSVKFQTDWYPQPEHGGFYTALAKGYYTAEGLDVTISPAARTSLATPS